MADTVEKKLSKTERALQVSCERCGSPVGVQCSLVFLTECDPERSTRHLMKRCHKERYIASA